MKGRCLTHTDASYHNYGARGIKIHHDWLKFYNFQNWALINGYKENLTIERINNNMDYEPDNCKLISKSDQSYNKRNSFFLNCFGETKCATLWLKDDRCCVDNFNTLKTRIKLGWDIEKAITEPVRNKNATK